MSDRPPTLETPSPLVRLLKYFFLGIFFLLLLALLLAGYVNWQGGRAWNNFRAEWEAKGERFDLEGILPRPVPPEQNIAATPLLATLLDFKRAPGGPIQWNDPEAKKRVEALGNIVSGSGRKKTPPSGNWQTGTFIDLTEWQEFLADDTNALIEPRNAARDVLVSLSHFEAELEELATASTRPHSVFPIRYEDNFRALLPHLAPLKGISQTLRLRALARLKAGQSGEALQDMKLALRLADSLKTEPLLISQLVRIAMINLTMQPIWEGLARHEWTEAQLTELQTALSNVQMLEDYGRAIRGERALGNASIDELRTGKISFSAITGGGNSPTDSATRFIPSGWYRQNQVVLNRLYQERCLPLVDAGKHRVYPDRTRDADEVPELRKVGLYNVFARLLFPAISKSAGKFANAQTAIDLATVACALERHRLANGQYPEQLDLLVPRFIAKIPTDVINGDLLKYRREPDGTFTLYSVGWNETDDGGEVSIRGKGTAPDPNEGDWVWHYPAK